MKTRHIISVKRFVVGSALLLFALSASNAFGEFYVIAGSRGVGKKITSSTVNQTVSALDPNTSEYTVEFIIPVDDNTNLTHASVSLTRVVYQGGSYFGECNCSYQRSSGAQSCEGWGDFPVTTSAKYRKHSAVVTCTFQVPPSGLYQADLYLSIDDYDPYTGGQEWRFPGIYGEAGFCMGDACP